MNGSEVAAGERCRGKVEATSAPTSKPIAAKVKTADTAGKPGERWRRASAEKPTSQCEIVATQDLVRWGGAVKAAEKTADGETSLVRALGLKINRIVIDAGHGGHDSGTLGVDGIQEKDVVLDVALRVGKLLQRPAGRGDHLHAVGRYVYPARDADGDCEQGAGGPVSVDPCEQLTGLRRRAGWRRTT